MEASISSRARECLTSHQTLCDTLQDTLPENGIARGFDVSSLTTVAQEGRARFKAWGVNIGAFHNPTTRTSLDSRLQEAIEIRSRILKILESVQQSLQQAMSIVSGKEANDTWKVGAWSGSEDGDSDNQDSQGDVPETSELDNLLSAIKTANVSLTKLSMVIRSSPARDDYLKATLHYKLDPKWYIDHVKEKHGSAKGCSEWLLERLGRAIGRRRQYLKYRQNHHLQVSKDWVEEQKDSKRPEKSIAPTNPSTKATTFVPNDSVTVMEPHMERAESVGSFGSPTSYEETTAGDEASHRLAVPRHPVMAFEGVPFKFSEPFQCPYCYTVQEVANRRNWKKHVFRDLKPYVCTFRECDLKMFGSRNEWFAHELQVHRREWVCEHCQAKPFSTAAEFRSHLLSSHNVSAGGSQLEALVLQSEEPVDKVAASACKLCDEWQSNLLEEGKDAKRLFLNNGSVTEPYGTLRQFRRHLGRHMEQLALFVLPKTGSDELEDDSDEDNQAEDNQNSDSGQSGFNDNPALRRYECPLCDTLFQKFTHLTSHLRSHLKPWTTTIHRQLQPTNQFMVPIERISIKQNNSNKVDIERCQTSLATYQNPINPVPIPVVIDWLYYNGVEEIRWEESDTKHKRNDALHFGVDELVNTIIRIDPGSEKIECIGYTDDKYYSRFGIIYRIPGGTSVSSNPPNMGLDMLQTQQTARIVTPAEEQLGEEDSISNLIISTTLSVHKKHHSALVGAGGSTIRDIVIKAGAFGQDMARTVQILPTKDDYDVIKISGTRDIVDNVVVAINHFIAQQDSRLIETIDVPAHKYPLLIGRGGETLKALMSKLNVSINVPRLNTSRASVVIQGQGADVENAKAYILTLVKDEDGDTTQVATAELPDMWRDDNDVLWMRFGFSRDRTKLEYTIRCDVASVDLENLTPEFKTENCIHPGAYVDKEQNLEGLHSSENESNKVGWAFANLNPALRGQKLVIQRAVECWLLEHPELQIERSKMRSRSEESTPLQKHEAHSPRGPPESHKQVSINEEATPVKTNKIRHKKKNSPSVDSDRRSFTAYVSQHDDLTTSYERILQTAGSTEAFNTDMSDDIAIVQMSDSQDYLD